jgi:hypothetical protein
MATIKKAKTFTELKEELNALYSEVGETSTKKCSQCSKDDLCSSCGLMKKLIASRMEELENIREQMPIPCGFLANGCPVLMRPSELKIHEKKCHRQTIACPIMDCSQNIFLAILTNHLHLHLRVHSTKNNIGWLFHSIRGTFEIPEVLDQRVCRIQWVEYKGQNFFLELIRLENGTWLSWIYCNGITDLDAAKFTCKIEYFRLDQRKSGSISYVGDPIPMTKNLKAISHERNCLIMIDQNVNNILKGGTKLAFELTITKKRKRTDVPCVKLLTK